MNKNTKHNILEFFISLLLGLITITIYVFIHGIKNKITLAIILSIIGFFSFVILVVILYRFLPYKHKKHKKHNRDKYDKSKNF